MMSPLMDRLGDTDTETSLRLTYAYDLDLPSPFAAPIQFLSTCRALADLGVDVCVLTGSLLCPPEECLANYGLQPHPLFRLVPLPWAAAPRTRRRRIEEVVGSVRARRHVVMSRGEPGVAFFRDLRGLALREGRLHVYEAHRPCMPAAGPAAGRLWRSWNRLRLRRLERAALAGADGLVCLTDGACNALRDLHPIRCPTLVLPSGTRIPASPPPDDAGRDLDVVYAGKLEPRKGVGVLLEAMRLLPGGRATIVGGSRPQVEEIERLAETLDVADRVSLPGFVSPAEVPSFWSRARVAVCPLPSDDPIARSFTSPLKLLEAMANGAPVVASDLPTVRAIATHDRTAVLVPPDRPEALAHGIRGLLDDRSRAARLAGAARSVAASYAWERRAERLRDFLLSLPLRSGLR
jgi:glycosyltransferase involved in cell wall biosynthesis